MKENREKWSKPVIEDLGRAKDLIKDINTTGGGDSQFSVLLPS